MNGEDLPIDHGATLRLCVETQPGYKMVKYVRSIELVKDYTTIGKGQGGFREDFQFMVKAQRFNRKGLFTWDLISIMSQRPICRRKHVPSPA
jgi:DMSO/TMAO reductase YedYZ molybdopterin-dependent catalytic subunit